MAHRNFARGSAPPANSWEWAGVAKPPGPLVAERKSAGPTKAAVFISETVIVTKPRRWPWALGGAALGFLLGRGSK